MKMKREGNRINRRETSKESHTAAEGEGTGQRARRTHFYLLGEIILVWNMMVRVGT